MNVNVWDVTGELQALIAEQVAVDRDELQDAARNDEAGCSRTATLA